MSIHFDSSDGDGVDYLQSSTPSVTAVPITFSSWVYPDAINDWDACIGVADSTVNNQYFSLTLRNNGTVRAETRATSFANSVGPSYTAGEWQHVAAVFASTSSRLAYRNGVAGTENTTDLTPSGINMLRIGQHASTAARPLDGLIAEVAMWNVALTAGEISQLADGFTALSVRPESLVSYYPLVRDYIDVMGTHALTPNNTVIYDVHPRIIEDAPMISRSAWGGI